MAYNESDEKLEIQSEIRKLEKESMGLDGELYTLAMKKKFLNHKLGNLKWNLDHPDDKV